MVRYQALKGLYEVERTIGCGGFAKVKLATHLATGEKVAIKIMNKAALDSDLPRVKLELKALQTLSHENICKLFQVIDTETHFFLIMEYCSGGELFDHIIEKNRLTESESRMFFRQIVSAVAYLHSAGFAHRDLKPENVLLDKYQNLKLIDFGLCANPDGGMTSPLLTSCGSPTYAAPELVTGKQYLGAEVDVWAMGVLLYALLSGTLPFDDVSVDALYKKILSGKYHEPPFISKQSLALLRSMLQVDPKKRITIKELLSHPWLTLGILEPVNFRGDDPKIHDPQCVEIMAKQHHVDPHTMWCKLKQWKYDYHTATYLILLMRKKRGSPLKLYNNVASKIISDTPKSTKADTPEIFMEKKCSTPRNQKSSPANGFTEPHTRRALKRVRSPIPEESSPIPTKKLIKDSTPKNTPNRDQPGSAANTPGSARKVFGSIERSFHKVVNVLTPRKTEVAIGKPALLTSKDLSNVSTTQCHSPEYVINRLSKALERKGIICKRKGFKLRGKTEPISGSVYGECSFELEICYLPNLGMNNMPTGTNTPTKSILKNVPLSVNVSKTCENDCNQVNRQEDNHHNFVGIRRKRLRGDAWCYKKVCEEVLALTSTDFQSIVESTV